MEDIALVTGATGFCGSHMVDLLVEKGWKVRATDLPNADKKFIQHYIDQGIIEFIPSDLTNKESLKPVVKDATYVFHPAAVFDYAAPWELLERVNKYGTKNLCETLIEEGKVKRFINWSTCGVYGEPDPEYQPTPEDAPKCNNCNMYEKSKWLQEQVVMEFQKTQGLPFTTIRPAPIYGPRNFYGVGQIIFILAKGQLPGIPVTAKGRVPFVHVKDIVHAAYFLSQKDEAIGEAYNVVDDTVMTMYEFAHFVAPPVGTTLINFYIPMSHVKFWIGLAAAWSEWLAKRRGTRPKIERETVNYITRSYWFSNEKLKKLGYQLIYPEAHIGLLETIEWYRKEGYLPGAYLEERYITKFIRQK